MLSRRQLRIKVMQALYAYFLDDKHDLYAAEKELFRGIEKSYDLYLTMLQLLADLVDEEEQYLSDKPKSQLSRSRFEKPKNLLSENLFLIALRNNKKFSTLVTNRKISWQKDHDAVKQVFSQIKKSTSYELPDQPVKRNWADDIDYILKIFQQFISGYEVVLHLLEEKNIYFAESIEFITSMVVKNLKAAAKSNPENFEIFDLFKDEEDDRDFVKNLFKDTVNNELITEKYIAQKSTNWDIDRLAVMDVIILKMAISEIVRFSSIPVKVSINEYIDLSKDYSTPKSGLFVNGVLDKIVSELKTQGKVVKLGRGLIE
jgi:N utilization substance protein B